MGIRERLRRRFRRSPDPEEIHTEMARDKGYGGRAKRKTEQDLLMQGNDLEDTEETNYGPIEFGSCEVMHDEIASSPFVVNMMARLVALEKSLKSKSDEVEALTAKTTAVNVNKADLVFPVPDEPIPGAEVRFKLFHKLINP